MKDDRRAPRIHATAWVAPSADVLGNVTLEEGASVWYHCVLRGDVAPITVGARSNVQDLTVIHADHDLPTRIGSDVGVGHRAILHGCDIGDGSLIGMGAIVLSGGRIGSGSVVAAGALVPEGFRVPEGQLVAGVPARVLRPVNDVLRRRIAETVESYARLAKEHRDGRWRRAPRPGGREGR